MRGLRERLARLAAWQLALSPNRGALYRAALVAGVVLVLGLVFGSALKLGLGEEFPGLVFLGWSLYLAGVLGSLRGIEQRWAAHAPWRTAIACTLLAYLACVIAVGQWHYAAAISQGQVAAWQAAWAGIADLPQGEGVLVLYVICQPLGAAVLFRQGKGDGSLIWANLTLVACSYVFALIVLGLIEEGLWRLPQRFVEPSGPEEGETPDEPSPQEPTL